jgi:L-arabinose isomerase
MGDFDVEDEVLRRRLSMTVDEIAPRALAPYVESVAEAAIEEEIAADRARYTVEAPPEVHRRSVRIGLGLRAFLGNDAYDALSLNFAAFDSREGAVDTVPFLEAAKAMARGLGYAGEGDVLTAALVGALSRAFGRTTFTEAFCPDWEGNAIFLSHMGEINPEVAAEKPHLVEKDFPWTGARNPAILACAPAPGPAVLVNLAPGPAETFTLLVCPVEVLADGTDPELRQGVRGWVRPHRPLPEFLEEYSRRGGTHHSALVLGDRAEAIAAFARFAGIEAAHV